MFKIGEMVMGAGFYGTRDVGVIVKIEKYKDTDLFKDTYESEDYQSCLELEEYLNKSPYTTSHERHTTQEEWEDYKNSTMYMVRFFSPDAEDTLGDEAKVWGMYMEEEELVSLKDIKKFIKNW